MESFADFSLTYVGKNQETLKNFGGTKGFQSNNVVSENLYEELEEALNYLEKKGYAIICVDSTKDLDYGGYLITTRQS